MVFKSQMVGLLQIPGSSGKKGCTDDSYDNKPHQINQRILEIEDVILVATTLSKWRLIA
jgi:hypothetical protein